MKSIVILISGRGSNLKAILEADLPVRIAAVISNRPDAEGLTLAKQHGIQTEILDHRIFSGRETFDTALAGLIDAYHPDLIVLAGFMRILTDAFVMHYQGRMINIHPSLLPAFPGLNTHLQALKEGVKIHGCTVHFVTPTLDHGPIIAQAAVHVLPADTPATLSSRVLEQEHKIFPQAIRWFAEGRLHLGDNGIVNLSDPFMSHSALLSPWESR